MKLVVPTFQRFCTDRRIRVSQAGRTFGITIFQKVFHWPAPSIRAASSRESGICSMNCFIRYRPREEDTAGRISDQEVLISPSLDIVR